MWLTLYNGNDLCLVLKRGKKKKKLCTGKKSEILFLFCFPID